MKNNACKPRIIEKVLKSALNQQRSVLVEGIKACGKTTACAKYSQSNATLDDAMYLTFPKIILKRCSQGPFPA